MYIKPKCIHLNYIYHQIREGTVIYWVRKQNKYLTVSILGLDGSLLKGNFWEVWGILETFVDFLNFGGFLGLLVSLVNLETS